MIFSPLACRSESASASGRPANRARFASTAIERVVAERSDRSRGTTRQAPRGVSILIGYDRDRELCRKFTAGRVRVKRNDASKKRRAPAVETGARAPGARPARGGSRDEAQWEASVGRCPVHQAHRAVHDQADTRRVNLVSLGIALQGTGLENGDAAGEAAGWDGDQLIHAGVFTPIQ